MSRFGYQVAGFGGYASRVVDHTWSTAASTMDAGVSGGAMFGSQTAAVYAAGYSGGAFVNNTQERNGTTWSTVSPVTAIASVLQEHGDFGSSPANGGIVGGWIAQSGNSAVTNLYDGETWSVGDPINTARGALRACGTTDNDAILTNGDVDGGSTTQETEKFESGTWVTHASSPAAAKYQMAFGTAAEAHFCGGYGYDSAMNYVNVYTDDSWATSQPLVAYQRQQGGAFGTADAAVLWGGAGRQADAGGWGRISSAEQWDGSTWTAEDNYPADVQDDRGCGTTTAGLGASGYTGATQTDANYTYE